MYGINDNELKTIIKIFDNHIEIDKVFIFGSRALGNYKKSSDIDLAISGKKITRNIILTLYDELNEQSTLPYYFDIIDYNVINNDNLKAHIDKFGKVIYSKG